LPINVHRTGFSMDVNQTAGIPASGRLALAWSESWDFSDEPFPALTTTVLRNESEPNDVSGSGVSFNVGDALQGTLSSPTDVDYWTVSLSAGQPVLIWGDSAAASNTVQIKGLDTDGTHIENRYGSPTGQAGIELSFRAPLAGTYQLFVRQGIGSPSNSFYRVRTVAGTPGAGEGQDLRDIAVIHSDGAGWSSPIRFRGGPIGYDDFR